MAAKQLSSVECICIEKRGFIPNRYYVYVLIVGWSDGEKHPIYRKYSSFYDFEKTLRDRIGNSSAIPELPTMNVLEKAFKIEKNHLNEISEFCMGILRLPQEIVNSHVISAFFEVWISDFPMEDSSEDNKAWAKKKDPKKRPQPETADHTSHTDKIAASAPNIETIPSAPYEEIIHSSPELVAESADEDIQVQEYVCTADYAPDSSSELSLTQGMKCVVLERNDDGWWFIMRESDGRQGYAPGSFLVPALPRKSHVESLYSEIPPLLNNNNNIKETGKWDPLMTARALCSYEASNEDEISYTKGEELQVLGTDNSGWWTVRCHAKVGLVPAVHLELTSPSSARRSTAFMKNNSLYSRKPPPRRQHSSVKDVDTDSVKKLVEPDSPTDSTPHIQAEYATVPDDMASKRFLVPSNKSQSAGLINYAELVFDDTDKQRVVKSSSNGGLVKPIPKKIASSSIIYTQIMPKNVRKAEEHSTPTTEASGLAGKKPERCKAVKKVPASKVDEVESRRKTPSPPASPPTISLGRESPVPIKPRTVRPDPTRTYENHTVPPPACNGDTKAEGHMYINIASGTSQGTSDTDTDYLRRSSIDPPPQPTVQAPKPSNFSNDRLSSMESYAPAVSTVHATYKYDGPNISGMLMFQIGDTALVMSKGSDLGWWYVNLGGLEGYVPGGYWEPCSTSAPSNTRTSQPNRQRAPQPVPRAPNSIAAPAPSAQLAPSAHLAPSAVTAITEEMSTREKEAWYHGKMSRPQSEKKLVNSANGVYLIRESVNRVGDLTLSVKWETKVRHFPIEAKEGGLYNIGKHDFKTLHAVISHYSKHPLFYSESNEPVKLKNAATKSS